MTTPTNDPERKPAPMPLEYGTPSAKKSTLTTAGIFVAALVSVLVVFGASLILLPRLNSPRAMSNPVRCASNLRQIGAAIQMYANEYNHQFPKDFATLLATEDITPEVFVCPSSSDSRAQGPTTQAVLADFAKPGHCSYVYFGAGMHDTDNPSTVVATEPSANHKGDGANVLFLDGHVEFFTPPDIQKIIAAATTQPTVWPPPGGL